MSRAPRLSRSDMLALAAAVMMLSVFVRAQAFKPTLFNTLVPVSFAVIAWLLKGVDFYGALAGASMAFIFCGSGGWRLFLVLLVVFVITLLATRIGTAHKKTVQIRKSRGRSASQVMANLFVPTAFLLIPAKSLPPLIAIGAAVGALAELAADTVSSEVGEAFGRPTYLITNWKRAETGTNGGVSLLGTISGVASALVVAASAFMLDQFDAEVWVCAIAGVAGMFVDSLLGATLESRGWLNNDAVNLLSTGFAAAFAVELLQFATY